MAEQEDSYRLKVLKALTVHLQGITRANGYFYDLAPVGKDKKVWRGRTSFGDETALPMLSILESPRSDVGQYADAGSERSEFWNLMVQGWVKDDVENPTDPAYGLMDAVERHLLRIIATGKNGQPVYPNEYRLGGLISDLVVPPGVVRPPQEGVSSKAFFYLPIRVGIVRPNQ